MRIRGLVRALVVASLAVGATAVVQSNPPAGNVAPAPAAATAPAPPVAPPGAEAAAPAPAPPAGPSVDKLSCDEAMARIDAALARADDAGLRADEISELVLIGRHAVDVDARAGSKSSACAARAARALRDSPACNRAFGAIASGVVGSDRIAASITAALLDGASRPACRASLVQSAQFAANVDDRLVNLAERIAASGADAPEIVASAWFALGSMELTARRHGQSKLAGRLDALIARTLHESTDDRRVLFLGVAGNAACRACEEDLRAAALDDDWQVRHAAAGAWRFTESDEAVKRMCGSLLGDEDADVREHAAWSLRWSDFADEDRVDCLVTAAATDASIETRKSATVSLTVLAPRSSRARSGLRHLTGPEYPGEVENLAHGFLLALGPMPGDELRNVE